MKGTIFLEHYRLTDDESQLHPANDRNGTFKAVDIRSNNPVTLTLIRLEQFEPTLRQRLESDGQAAQLLDHINIGKVLAVGVEDKNLIVASEFVPGETIEAWIATHGPMSPDAVLRVALQIVGALGAASFQGVSHGSISPSNVVIVPGQTAEGGWPLIKVVNFGIPRLQANGTSEDRDAGFSEFASPEQLANGTVDFRSDIYSVGATMCLMLTGAFYSAEPRSLQTRRFAKPLRNLIAPMLRQNPAERPQDPLLVNEELRTVLLKIERRQALARRFGIPFVAVHAKPPKRQLAAVIREPSKLQTETASVIERPREIPIETSRRWIPALAIVALLLTLAVVGAMLVPAPVSMILQRNRSTDKIGVPIGIPESSPGAQNLAATSAPSQSMTPSPPSLLPNPSIASSTPTVTQTNPPLGAQSSPAQTVSQSLAAAANPPPATTAISPAAGESDPPAEAPNETPAESITKTQPAEIAADTTDDDKVEPTDRVATSQPEGPSKTKRIASKKAGSTKSSTASSRSILTQRNLARSRSPRYSRRSFVSSLPEGPGTFRARYIGTTPDGLWVLELPSGETAVVPPTAVRHRSHRPARRVLIERRSVFLPPPSFGPMFPPDG